MTHSLTLYNIKLMLSNYVKDCAAQLIVAFTLQETSWLLVFLHMVDYSLCLITVKAIPCFPLHYSVLQVRILE